MEMNALALLVSYLDHYKTTGDVSEAAHAKLLEFADMANRYFTAYAEDPSIEYYQVLKNKDAYPTAQEKVEKGLRDRGFRDMPGRPATEAWVRDNLPESD